MPVAVRSSATAEDSAEASFAGQQDTYLWIIGEEAVVEHVKRCWASLYRDRSHRLPARRAGSTERTCRWRSSCSGWCAPRRRRRDDAQPGRTATARTIAIESSFGLGETVVGGTVTPDSFLVDKVMLEIVESKISCEGHRARARRRPAAACVERTVEAERTHRPVAHRATRSSPSPRSPSRPSGTTAARRTSSGRSTDGAVRPAPEPPRDRLVAQARAGAGRRSASGSASGASSTPDQSPGREEDRGCRPPSRLSGSSAPTRTRRPRAPRAGRSCTPTTSLPRGPARGRGGRASGSPTSSTGRGRSSPSTRSRSSIAMQAASASTTRATT